MTEDHVPPRAWYPDTTPSSVQYWKIPSCAKCNGELARIERDLLIRFGLCVDPAKPETSGLAPRALRTIGLDTGKLSDDEQGHRDRTRARIRKELMLYDDVAETTIRGLGPPDGSPPEVLTLPIAYSDISRIAEKMARGFEYKRSGRFVEPPYGLRTFIGDPSSFISDPSKLLSEIYGEEGQFDLGPRFKIKYVFSPEHPANIGYWFPLWGILCLSVLITRDDMLRAAEPRFSRPKGLTREDIERKRKFPT
jgi:hypothetical protein